MKHIHFEKVNLRDQSRLLTTAISHNKVAAFLKPDFQHKEAVFHKCILSLLQIAIL